MSLESRTDDWHDDAIDERAIAIVGLSGRFPGAADARALWANLERGVEAIRPLSDDALEAAGVDVDTHRREGYVKAASVLDDVERFDAEFFGYNPREAAILDPQQRLFLEEAWTAMENAGHAPSRFDGLIGVYAGVAWNTYLLSNLMTRPELFDGAGAFQVFITSDKDFMPTRLSYKLDLKGPSVLVQTSCSTSLVATHLACLALQSYECDMALVGGSTVKVPSGTGYFYEEGGLASPDGHCRAFDARAAGTVFGSGVGVVALRRLADALDDGDPIRAVILGSAINNDGSMKVSYTAPSVEGQAEVIAAAQEMAGVDPETIRYVECHGTGTKLGDPIEVRALDKVFRARTDAEQFCALGSIKTNLGHLDAAAGVAGLIKTTLALEHGRIPPSLHFETPNPAIDFAGSPFYVAAEALDWPSASDEPTPRRAAVSSFGVGGTNAHAVLEQAPPPEPSDPPARTWQLVPWSARDEVALDEATARLAAALPELSGEHALADAAFTLADGRETFRHRRFVVADDLDDAAARLTGDAPGRLWSARDHDEPRSRGVAFLFPGQGSQYLGMASGLHAAEPVFRQVVDRCCEHLAPTLGIDLRRLLLAEPDDEALAAELARTRLTQPALFVVELALAAWWRAHGVEPRALAGHSIGELVAATVAGTFDETAALDLVAERGRLMDALPTGDMVAVPLAEAAATAWLAERPALAERVAVAVLNEAERSVLSGDTEAIDEARAAFAADGVDTRPLHTSHAFHSPMMAPMLDDFARAVRAVELRPPSIPFVSNVTGTWITDQQATDPDYWVRHARQPVRFADNLATLCAADDRVFLEVGPGRTLTTLASRHSARRDDQPTIPCLRHPREAAVGDRRDQPAVLTAFGRLWLAGVDVDLAALYRRPALDDSVDEGSDGDHPEQHERRRRLALPTYAFQRRRYWIDPRPRATTDVMFGGDADPLVFAADDAATTKRPIDRWTSVPAWSRTPALPAPDHAAYPAVCCVFGDPEGPGGALAERFRRAGGRAVVVAVGDAGSALRETGADAFSLDPEASPSQIEPLIRHLGGLVDGGRLTVVHAWSLAPATAEPEDARRLGFGAVLRWVQGVARATAAAIDHPAGLDLLVLGSDLVAVVDGEPVRPHAAPLLGLARTIAQEWPSWRTRVVDLDARDLARTASHWVEAAWAEAIDLTAASPATNATQIAWRGVERWSEGYLAAPTHAAHEASSGLREGGTYLLTGGLRGNGHAIARLLARRVGARLVLVDRDDASDGDSWGAERLQDLRDLGAADVRRHVLDTRDVAAWRALFDAWDGPLDGVFHAASTHGEGTFRTLDEADDTHVDGHFDRKIATLSALDEALDAARRAGRFEELEIALLVGSLATVLGGLAYGVYAAANSFLEAFVHARRGDERPTAPPWRVVSWDVWRFEHDDTPQITDLRGDLAALAMTTEEGERALLRALALDPAPHVFVSTADLAARRAAATARSGATDARAALGERHPRPELPTPFVAPESELQERIAEIWGSHLGLDGLGIDDNFFDLGGDSFIAVRVAARLREALEVELPVVQLYEHLTIRSLAELLELDTDGAREERAQHLEARRQSMGRRQELLRRRRGRRGRHDAADADAR